MKKQLVTLWAVYIGWFFLFMRNGLDVTDQAYYLTKYKYFFSENVNVRSMGTILTELTGGLIYSVLPGNQALIFSVLSWGLYLISGILIFFLFKEYCENRLLLLFIMGGSFFSMTWVHTMNYNSTSMLLLVFGIFILVKGIQTQNRLVLTLAGFCAGINIFFRLPNILQVCMGGAIFWHFAIVEKKWKEGIRYCCNYAIGVIGSVVVGGGIAFQLLDKEKIMSYFSRTVNTVSNGESSHSISSMLEVYFEGIQNGIINLLLCCIGLLIIFFIGKVIEKKLGKKIKRNTIISISFLFGGAIAISYSVLTVLEMVSVIILLTTLMGSIYFLKCNKILSSICIIGLITEALLIIGTNNGWYYQVVFLMFPLGLIGTIYFHVGKIPRYKAICNQIIAFVLGVMLVSGACYANNYVYRDEHRKNLDTAVDVKEYKSILSTSDRAEYVKLLTTLLSQYENKTLLAYGDINVGYVVTNMEPFFECIWSDLESFSEERFEKELNERREEHPVILLADLNQDEAFRSQKKLEMLLKYMEEEKYTCVFTNEWYSIYEFTDK